MSFSKFLSAVFMIVIPYFSYFLPDFIFNYRFFKSKANIKLTRIPAQSPKQND